MEPAPWIKPLRPQPEPPAGPAGAEGRQRGGLPLRAMLPNAITLAALAAGLTAVRFALGQEFDRAAIAIVVAAVLDTLDGRVARLVRGTSRFGAELDSLSDVIAFGVAPALVLYLWALQSLGSIGWVVSLALAVCCALRLARFNAALDLDDAPHRRLGFFTGVPAPAGAGLALLPLFAALGFDLLGADQLDLRAGIVVVTVVLASLLMVSTLPTWSWSALRLPRRWRILALAAIALLAAGVAQAPFAVLTAVALAYALSMPFAWASYRRRKPPKPARARA